MPRLLALAAKTVAGLVDPTATTGLLHSVPDPKSSVSCFGGAEVGFMWLKVTAVAVPGGMAPKLRSTAKADCGVNSGALGLSL